MVFRYPRSGEGGHGMINGRCIGDYFDPKDKDKECYTCRHFENKSDTEFPCSHCQRNENHLREDNRDRREKDNGR